MEKIERTYDVDEVAELCHVSRKTIYRWRREGRITGKKLGKRILFTESEVNKLFDANEGK